MKSGIVAAVMMTIVLSAGLISPGSAQTPQQLKMKECAAKWKEEKARTGVKGRDAYRAFLRECLKKKPAQ